jgi:triosephosphate isomerase
MMKRKPLIAGNWKMNTSLEKARELATEIKGMVLDEVNGNVEIILIPPFTHLSTVNGLLSGSNIKTGAQNCSQFYDGAYTGEISAAMLQSLKVGSVLVGHSERRQYFGETNQILAEKVKRALEAGLTLIFCCGEMLSDRESEKHFEVVKTQLDEGLFHIAEANLGKIVIAYEPVWAIGTGRTASASQAQEMHAFIRRLVIDHYSERAGKEMRILYGGSVKSGNAKELFSCEDIDGGLIGGAALESRGFTDIVKAAL